MRGPTLHLLQCLAALLIVSPAEMTESVDSRVFLRLFWQSQSCLGLKHWLQHCSFLRARDRFFRSLTTMITSCLFLASSSSTSMMSDEGSREYTPPSRLCLSYLRSMLLKSVGLVILDCWLCKDIVSCNSGTHHNNTEEYHQHTPLQQTTVS